MSDKMPVRPVAAFVLLSIGLAACAATGSTGVRCGLQPNTSSVSSLLESSKNCPRCLLNEVGAKIKSCPQDKVLLLTGMYSGYRAGDLSRAVEYYESLRAEGAATSSEHADAAFMYRSLGVSGKSLSSFRLAVASDDDPMLRYELAVELVRLKQYEEAVGVLTSVVLESRPVREDGNVQSIGSDAIFDEASLLLGQSHEVLGRFADARTVYTDVLSVYPNDPRAIQALERLKSQTSGEKEAGRERPPSSENE